MPTTPDPKQEHPSTYVVQDRSNQEEMLRLQKQDQLLTAAMGGVLAEQPDPASLKRVLDIGCGTGGWLLETARTYPTIELLIGVDISKRMVDFAREQVKAEGLVGRVEFHVMDALRMLEFPDDYFDLVNIRSSMSYLRTWDWPKFLDECRRVCRSGAILRITEGNIQSQSTSPAMVQLLELLCQAFFQAGHLFTPTGDGLIKELPRLLERFGFQEIQTREYTMVTGAGTEARQLAYEDARMLFRTLQPFLQKWASVPSDYQSLYQQMLHELQQPNFESTTFLYTTWCMAPVK